jgi:hypothetical protein
MMEEEESMGGEVGGLLDEINVEEQGLSEEEAGEEDLDFGDEEEVVDLEGDDLGAEEGEGDLEDRVVDLEDKLDELMAEFEEIMAGEAEEPEHTDEFGGEEAEADEEDMGDEGSEEVMESVALQPVKGLYGSKIGGDNGQAKSPVAFNAGQAGMAAKPVNASTADEKGRAAPTAKQIPGTYKNAAGQKKQDLVPATKPTTSQAAGVNNKSPLGEGRRK